MIKYLLLATVSSVLLTIILSASIPDLLFEQPMHLVKYLIVQHVKSEAYSEETEIVVTPPSTAVDVSLFSPFYIKYIDVVGREPQYLRMVSMNSFDGIRWYVSNDSVLNMKVTYVYKRVAKTCLLINMAIHGTVPKGNESRSRTVIERIKTTVCFDSNGNYSLVRYRTLDTLLKDDLWLLPTPPLLSASNAIDILRYVIPLPANVLTMNSSTAIVKEYNIIVDTELRYVAIKNRRFEWVAVYVPNDLKVDLRHAYVDVCEFNVPKIPNDPCGREFELLVKRFAASFRSCRVRLDLFLKQLTLFLNRMVVYSLDTSGRSLHICKNIVEELLLFRKKGMCIDFASAFSYISKLFGLNSRVTVGWYRIGPGIYSLHAWSEIVLDKSYVYIDPTPTSSNTTPTETYEIGQNLRYHIFYESESSNEYQYKEEDTKNWHSSALWFVESLRNLTYSFPLLLIRLVHDPIYLLVIVSIAFILIVFNRRIYLWIELIVAVIYLIKARESKALKKIFDVFAALYGFDTKGLTIREALSMLRERNEILYLIIRAYVDEYERYRFGSGARPSTKLFISMLLRLAFVKL